MHIAYIAGLIDGEGSIMLLDTSGKRGWNRVPAVSVTMTDHNVLYELHAQEGGHLREVKTSTTRSRRWAWEIRNHNALSLLRQIRPYLHIERRQVLADMLLGGLPQHSPKRSTKDFGLHKAQTDNLWTQMKARNAIRKTEIPIIAPSPPTKEDYAYLAGILDGEGHFDARAYRCDIHSTDPELIGWLTSKFGGHSRIARKSRDNRRTTWRWVSRKQETLDFGPHVLPHLRIEHKHAKLEQYLQLPPAPSWVLNALPGTIKDVSEASGRERNIVERTLKDLTDRGILTSRPVFTRRAGRPPKYYDFAVSNRAKNEVVQSPI